MNLVTVNVSLKHHNTTSRKGTRKNAGMERSKKKKQEQTSNKKGRKRNRPTRKEQKKKNCKYIAHSQYFYLSLSINLGIIVRDLFQ